MTVQGSRINFVLCAILSYTLLVGVFTRAQDDACVIYGDDYVCPNDTSTVYNVPFDENSTCTENLYENVMKLLEDGQKILEEEFALIDSDKAVMMIGNTGTGKSTLTYFLAGDNSQMFSYSIETEVFGIKDCNGKIGSGDTSLVSATIYPDLVIENSTGTPFSFFDNPGFEDTRTACVEIANAFFMQQITDHIKKVKFVIVVNKFDVSSIGSREDFPRALRNVFNFVPNIEKFGSGLALVATKLVAAGTDDAPFVQDVVNFMNKSKNSFPEILDSEEEIQKASFIVDSIMNVSRVGVFRTPKECGPLSEISPMQDNRANILKVVLENIQYVDCSPEDFALTISAEAQIKVIEVGIELARTIEASIQTFSSAIYNYFMFHFNCTQLNNCDDLVDDLEILLSNPDFVKEYDEGDFINLNFTEIVRKITQESFIPPNLLISLAPGFIEDLVASAGRLDFLNKLVNLHVDTRSWLQLLKDTHRYLKEHVGRLVSEVDQTFVKILKELAADFQITFENNLKALIDGKSEDSTTFEEAVVGLYDSSYILGQTVDGLDPSRYVREINESILLFNNGFSDEDYLDSQLLILFELSSNLDSLTKSFNNSFSSSVNPKSWVVPLTSLKSAVSDHISVEIGTVTNSIGNKFSELLTIVQDFYSQLKGDSAKVLYQNLDIALRQFGSLNTFSKSVSEGQVRQDFMSNWKLAVDSVNGIFIILGTQVILSDMIRLDRALIVLERLNTDETGVIPDKWATTTQNSTATMLSHIFDFASTDVNDFVQRGANTTATALTSRLTTAYNVTDYPVDKQRNFTEDYQKVQGLVSDLSTCTTFSCFSSKNFLILTQLSEAASVDESALQKLPGQNLVVDLGDLGQNPYQISEWQELYEDVLAVLTTLKTLLNTDRPVLESERKTNWGSWGTWDLCPEGTFVTGMQLKDDQCTPSTYKDCVALSGVLFFAQGSTAHPKVRQSLVYQSIKRGTGGKNSLVQTG